MAKRRIIKLSKKELKSQKRKNGLNLNMGEIVEGKQSTDQDVSGLTGPINQAQVSSEQIDPTSSDQTKDKQVAEKIKLEIPKVMTVKELSERMDLTVTKVIEELMNNGVMASINESVDFETAQIIGDEFGFDIVIQDDSLEDEKELTLEEKSKLKNRPPVVVVLGHVDHGKTTLLDQIRKSDVISTESGGITQHIGAYQVNWKSKEDGNRIITLLDTPGHAAFSAMRAHGANITDIAILVVAADDGVKPQTKEAISHAKAAGIPIIVAINKIDKPEADTERVKRDLADNGLNPEEWGGDTVIVEVSAKQGKGIEDLLDLLLVTADLQELKANPDKLASGVVIESHMQAGIGAVATVLIQAGTLESGQVVVIGGNYGRIRRMEDYQGNVINQAGPSTPVRIAGVKQVANFGDHFEVVENEKQANLKIQNRTIRHKKLGLLEISEKIKSGEIKNLNIVLKSDVQGSIEAIKNSLSSLSVGDVTVSVISEGVGDINESDINLAIASDALVVGFRSKPTIASKNLADQKSIKISTYNVIYQLIDDISAAMSGLLEPEIIETSVGKFEVIKIFHSTKNNKIIGGKVVDGKIIKGSKFHHYHSGEKVADGKITTLQKENNPVEEVEKGFECGMGVEIISTIKSGDLIEVYKTEEIIKKINS